MIHRPVHYHEGMFLRPQHFQAQQRHVDQQMYLGDRWNVQYNWGLYHIQIDRDALANHRLVIHSLQARFPDGTIMQIPEVGVLPALELKALLEQHTRLDVYLALPVLRLGRANLSSADRHEGGRFSADMQQLEDENSGVNAQDIQLRSFNVRLLVSTEDLAGYEVLKLARIEKSADAKNTPQIDVSFIPAVLGCDVWQPLQVGILQTLYDRIGSKSQLLAAQIISRGIAIQSMAADHALIVGQLRILNDAYAILFVLMMARGVHPFTLYLELCRVVGQLSIYGLSRRPPDLPPYDHDDLGTCFYRIKRHIDTYLDLIVEPAWKQRPFEGAGFRMQVPLEPSWLEPAWQMYVGVQSTLATDDVVRLLTKSGQLDIKIGSSDRVDLLFQYGQAGLKFRHQANPPATLPVTAGLTFFEILREAQLEEWSFVKSSLFLAIRFNEIHIDGNIHGLQTLKLKTTGHPIQFTLYVLKTT